MRNFLLPALAAVAILAMMPNTVLAAGTGMITREMLAPSLVRGTADLPLRIAGVVCGNNGCAPAQTSAPRRRRFVPLGHG